MKNLKLGFFSLFTAVLGHTCPSEVIPLDGGRWNCGGFLKNKIDLKLSFENIVFLG